MVIHQRQRDGHAQEPEWFMVRLEQDGERAARIALHQAGIRLFQARRRPRPSPIPRRARVSGATFPGHLFVAPTDRPPEILLSLPGIHSILQHEKNRPMVIPPNCIAALRAYCAGTEAEDVPPDLRLLDVLSSEDRLCHFLEWIRAGRQCDRLFHLRPTSAARPPATLQA